MGNKGLKYKNFAQITGTIIEELDFAEKKHSWPDDTVDRLSIITEEMGEAVQAANNYKFHGNKKIDLEQVEKELIQVAAMVFRYLKNLKEGINE